MTLVESLLVLTAMLFVKHFLADGPLQTPYQLAGKSKLLHPGGLAHAGIHAGLTGLCLAFWAALLAPAGVDLFGLFGFAALVLLPLEFVVHYLIDYAKCAVDALGRWSTTEIRPDGARLIVIEKCDAYFIAFLVDQLAHAITLIGLVALLATQLG